MAFRTPPSAVSVPDTPDKLFRELTRRKFPDVLPHQAEVMQAYARTAVALPDVAMQLPTGSGKTLVGLLVAEWRRRKFQERVVYLCPTRQLVHQVASQANDKYGLSVATFVGSQRDYAPSIKADYRQAQKVAITTYSGLFNTNSFFDDADVILVDDAHASENYIAGHWSIRVERGKEQHAALHQALTAALAPYLKPTDLTRLRGVWDDPVDRSWVDKIPTPTLHALTEQIAEVLDAHADDADLKHPWSLLRSRLEACHVYVSSQDILIRPLLPPTFSHRPFADAKQRIFMSATLGAGGDLERLTGRKSIHRLAAPRGWDTQGVGRRFFVFPQMSLRPAELATLRAELMSLAGRSVVLVPSDNAADAIAAQTASSINFPVFRARDIEQSKARFVSAPQATAIVANRYDGVDFAGDECRLLFIEGLPRATNSQERFLMSRMGANTLYNERIQTRVVQAIGRCTRSLEDFSAVIVSGDDLPDYLADIRRRKYFHPELQAEISFGAHQSKDTNLADIVENVRIFLENGADWERANRTIVDERNRTQQAPLPAIDQLQAAVDHEIDYQTALWRADHESAVAAAEKALGCLVAPELRGYRALWNYLAGSASHLGAKRNIPTLEAKARQHFREAQKCAPDISWLDEFTRRELPDTPDAVSWDAALSQQVGRLGAELARLGSTHDREFAKLEKSILEGVRDPARFEQTQVALGNLIGFVAGKREEEGSPDPWWISGAQCIVFEDYVNTTSDSELDVTKARQASSHPDWMKAHVPESIGCEYFPVIVSPARQIRAAAVPHAGDLLYWELSAFAQWAELALQTARELRATFFEEGDLVWQAQAATRLRDNGIDFASLLARLKTQRAVDAMSVV
jgi:hypothetical protein